MPKLIQSHLNGIFRPRLLPTGSEAPDGILLSGLKGHWDLSEVSGTRLDSTSYANHMVEAGITPIAQAAGVGGSQTAASFAHAGGQQYLVSTETSPSFVIGDTDPFFLNFWLRFSSSAATWRSYLATSPASDAAGGSFNLQIEVTSGNGQANFKTRNLDDSTINGVNPGASVTNATWFMVSLYANTADNTKAVYLNGSLAAGAVFAGSFNSVPLKLLIGNSWTGRMQALSVWRGAGAVLAKDNMSWLYNSGTSARLYSDISTYMG